MPSPPSALKKSLVREGFEIYRTSPNLILLADRVRDNLLMEAGVAAVEGETLAVRIVLRAHAIDFPGETPEGLFTRARALGDVIRKRGYQELRAEAVPVLDPSDKARSLDTWYEVSYELPVADETALFNELRFALGVRKTVDRA